MTAAGISEVLTRSSNGQVSGQLQLQQLAITGQLVGLGGFLPPITVRGSGSYDLATGQGSFGITDDAMLDAYGSVLVAGVHSLGQKGRQVADMVRKVPIIGQDVGNGLGNVIAQPLLDIQGPAQGVRGYLLQRGFQVEDILSWQEIINGDLSKDVLVLRYLPPAFSSSSPFSFQVNQRRLGNGQIGIELGGSISADPSIQFDIRFGVNAAKGPFLIEGSSIDVQLPIDGQLTGSAFIKRLGSLQLQADAQVDIAAELTLSDFDSVPNERFYLLAPIAESPLDVYGMMERGEAITLGGTFQLDAQLTASNPAAQIPFIGDLLGQALQWNASLTYDMVSGALSYNIQTDQLLADIVALFQDAEELAIQKFFSYVDRKNPMSPELRSLLSSRLPIVNKSPLELLGAPPSINLLLNPTAYAQNRGADDFDENISDARNQSRVDFKIDIFNPVNVMALLVGDTVDLISIELQQDFRADLSEITLVPDTPFFSFFGILNATFGLNVRPAFGLKASAVIGWDTDGFYFREQTQNNVELYGGLELLIGVGGAVGPVPVVRIDGVVGLEMSAGIRIDVPDNPDQKARLNQLTNLEYFTTNIGVDAVLGIDGKVGVPEIGLGKNIDGPRKRIPIFDQQTGSIADLLDEFTAMKQRMDDEIRRAESALKALPLGPIASAVCYANPEACEALAEGRLGDFAKSIEAGARKFYRDPYGWMQNGLEKIGIKVNQRDLEIAFPGLYGVKIVGGVIDNFSALIFGDCDKVEIPSRQSFTVSQSGGEVAIAWDQASSDAFFGAGVGADILIEVVDGQLKIDGKDFARSEKVASCESAFESWDVYRTVTHTNSITLPIAGITSIRFMGSPFDDSLILKKNLNLPSRIEGYDGNDILVGGSGDNVIYGGAGGDTISSQAGRGVLYGEDGDDLLIGSGHDDHMEGGSGADTIDGGEGNDLIHGQDGDDRIIAGNGVNVVYAGSGDDIIQGGRDDDTLHGEDGDDKIFGYFGNDVIYAADGDDLVLGGEGNDTIYGGTGADQLIGDQHNGQGSGEDVIYGQEGDDLLGGGGGDDELFGGAGADQLIGQAGNDWLVGQIVILPKGILKISCKEIVATTLYLEILVTTFFSEARVSTCFMAARAMTG